jgi:uncharacterized protein YkwD
MMPHMICPCLLISRASRPLFFATFALGMPFLVTAISGCIGSPKSQHLENISYPAPQHQPPPPPVRHIQQPQISHTEATCVSTSNFQVDMLDRVNRIRAAGAVCGGVRYPSAAPLRWSNQLQQAAAVHSRDMAEHNFFNHKSATNGTTLPERLRSVGYRYQAAGENIGAGPATVAQVVDMWVASPGHCVTLMTANFVDLGASCKNNNNSYYKTYWTLKAATPS